MTIPGPIKKLFNSFPFEQYPSIEAELPKALQQRKFYLNSNENFEESASKFTLGVYGLFKHSSGLLLATDPVCLFSQLFLCSKNKLKIPKFDEFDKLDSSELLNRKQNSIMILSYQASKDSQLPILIEDDYQNKTAFKRSVRSSYLINELQMSKIEENQDYILTELIDQVFYDIWTFTIITELSSERFLSLYNSVANYESPLIDPENFYNSKKNLQEEKGLSIADKFILKELLVQLVHRHQFSDRYPVISENFHQYAPNFVILFSKPHKLSSEIERIFENFIHVLEKLKSINFLDSKKNSIGKWKLVSYLICIKTFLEDTKAYNIIKEGFPELLEICESHLEEFQ